MPTEYICSGAGYRRDGSNRELLMWRFLSWVVLLGIIAGNARAAPYLKFTFSPLLDPKEAIIESLDDGHRAEIRYEARIYRRTTGVNRLFGDRLIAEEMVTYEARWDELNSRYIVVVDEEFERSFFDADDLLAFLLILDNHIIRLPNDSSDAIYLMCRAQVEPILLVPPLTLLAVVIPKFRMTTPWMRTEFERFE